MGGGVERRKREKRGGGGLFLCQRGLVVRGCEVVRRSARLSRSLGGLVPGTPGASVTHVRSRRARDGCAQGTRGAHLKAISRMLKKTLCKRSTALICSDDRIRLCSCVSLLCRRPPPAQRAQDGGPLYSAPAAENKFALSVLPVESFALRCPHPGTPLLCTHWTPAPPPALPPFHPESTSVQVTFVGDPSRALCDPTTCCASVVPLMCPLPLSQAASSSESLPGSGAGRRWSRSDPWHRGRRRRGTSGSPLWCARERTTVAVRGISCPLFGAHVPRSLIQQSKSEQVRGSPRAQVDRSS